MLQKVSPDQLKFGLLMALLIYLVNGQNTYTSAKTNRSISNQTAPPSLAATTLPTSTGVCTTAQRSVQVVSDAVLNLRSYPNGPVVQTLASGEIVTAQHRDGAWLQITTAAGQSGWAFSQYLGCR